jgi:hypothetical protein
MGLSGNMKIREDIVFSNHAKDRMAEYKIGEEWVQHLWQKTLRYKLPFYILKEKLKKYGKLENRMKYYRRCGYLLTVNYSDKPVLVTITKCYSNKIKLK